jgi:hypothetical protein
MSQTTNAPTEREIVRDIPHLTCKHCGVAIVSQDGIRWGHKAGPGSIVIRCNTRDSGQPYGLEAAPDTARVLDERASE